MKRIQRKRTRGWRMPEGAVYVGRPSAWGNPFPWDADWSTWLALALGQRADRAGRHVAAVIAYRWWVTDGLARHVPFPVPVRLVGDGDIEYADGSVRSIVDVVVGLGVMMLASRGALVVPLVLDLAPLRGRDLVCWCPEPCGADVALYEVAYGDQYESCAKPRGHEGGHDPSVPPWCHADVLLQLLAEPAP